MDPRREQARRMRDQGMTQIDIAHEFGVGQATIWRWLHPEEAAAINRARRGQKRTWERTRLAGVGTCSQCGGPRSVTRISQATEEGRCIACINAGKASIALTCASIASGMWADGWYRREIIEVLGLNGQGSLSYKIAQWRKRYPQLPFTPRPQAGRPGYHHPGRIHA